VRKRTRRTEERITRRISLSRGVLKRATRRMVTKIENNCYE